MVSREAGDVQNANFWKDAVRKEKRVRLNWLAAYDPEKRKELVDRKIRLENALGKMSITADMANDRTGPLTTESQELGGKLSEFKPEKSSFKRYESLTDYKNQAKDVQLRTANGQIVDLMRTVTPNTKGLIYEGLSKEDEGRKKYLKTRKSKAPEEKYNEIISENYEYGWNQSVMRPNLAMPKYGKTPVVNMEFYRNS